MTRDIDYGAVPIRDDMRRSHRMLFEHIRAPGTWWTGAERVAIAAETRQAMDCDLCQARKDRLSPAAVAGQHETLESLPENVVEVIHRVRTDPARLSRVWFDERIGNGLDVPAYVELVAVVTMVTGVDYFAHAMGLPLFSLPEALGGEPSRHVPAGAKPGTAWVPVIAPDDVAGAEADLYPRGAMIPNVMQALSLVPAEARMLHALAATHYLPIAQITDATARRALDRAQMELVAARVSAMNQCFYCTTTHATLLQMTGGLTGTAVDLTAVDGASETDAGVRHGADLLAFTEALMKGDPATLERERLHEVLSPEEFVETAALVAAFNVVDRVADATGVRLDAAMDDMSRDVRRELGLDQFASAANGIAS